MEEFIIRQNIARFLRLLEIECDDPKRHIVELLLAQEEAKTACSRCRTIKFGLKP